MSVDARVSVTPADGRVPSARRGAAGWAARTYWCWPLVVTAGLGLYQVAQPVLWRDELSGWALASRGLPKLLATARTTDGAQLPYYLVLHYWMAAFGSSVLSMRVLSVLFMAGAAVFVALAARELAGPRAAVASGLVFALIPSVSRFAQEVRFYAPMMFFAALATWLLARALNRRSWPLWAGYAAAMGAMGWMEIVAMALLAGHASWVVLRWWRDRSFRPVAWFVAAAIVSGMACAPIILLGHRQALSQVYWVPKPSFWPQTLGQFGSNLFYSGPVAVAVLMLAVLAWKFEARLAGYLTAATLVPVAAICALSYGSVSYFVSRYVLFTLITLAICAGTAVAAMGRRSAVVAVAGLALLGFHDQMMIRQADAHDWSSYPVGVQWNTLPYQQVASIVGVRVQPGDAIVYPGQKSARETQLDLGMDYYMPRYLHPGVSEPRQTLLAQTAIGANDLYPHPCDHPNQCVGHARRVWVVGADGEGNNLDPLQTLVPAQAGALRHYYTMTSVWHIGDVAIGLLDRRGASDVR